MQYDRKLRTEFQTLRSLIGRADEIIWKEAEKVRLKTALKVSTLQTLILKDTLSQTATDAAKYLEAKISADADNQRILEELRTDTDSRLPSLIELLPCRSLSPYILITFVCHLELRVPPSMTESAPGCRRMGLAERGGHDVPELAQHMRNRTPFSCELPL
jgi:hypothetical protein